MNRRTLMVAYLAAVFMWSLLSYCQIFEYLKDGVLFARTIAGKPYLNDFANAYNASFLTRRCLEQTPKPDIYDPHVQDVSLRKLVAPVVPESPFYFQYPPYCFLVVLPLSLVSMPIAWCIWNALFLSTSVLGLLTLVQDRPAGERKLLAAIALCTFPFWLCVQLGQWALVILLPAILFFRFLQDKRSYSAGIAAGFIAVKMQYLPAFGLLGLLLGGWRFLVSAACTVLGLLGVSALVLGLDNVLRFPSALMTYETGSTVAGVNSFMMQNLRGELWLLLRNNSALVNVTALIGMCAGLAALAFIWRKREIGRESSNAIAVSVIIILLTSLHTHTQDYVLAAIAGLIWWQLWTKPGTILTNRQRIARTLLFAFPAISWMFQLAMPIFQLLFIQPFFIWALCMLVLVVPTENNHADSRSEAQ